MTQNYAVPPQATVALPIDGSAATFPVRRVYCVGRNYAAPRTRLKRRACSPGS